MIRIIFLDKNINLLGMDECCCSRNLVPKHLTSPILTIENSVSQPLPSLHGGIPLNLTNFSAPTLSSPSPIRINLGLITSNPVSYPFPREKLVFNLSNAPVPSLPSTFPEPFPKVFPSNFPKVRLESCPKRIYTPENWTQINFGQVGLHVGLNETLSGTLEQMNHFGCRCCQIYLGNKTTYQVRSVNPQDLQYSEYQLLQNRQSLYVHGPLTVNIGQKWDDPKLFSGMKAIRDEIEMVWNLPASVVLHFGKGLYGGTIESMAQVVNHLDLTPGYYSSNPYRLLLENDAGQGTSLVKSIEDFRHFYEVLDRTVVGLCLDTQHCFAGGMCDWSNHDQTIKFLEGIEEAIGSKSLSLIHLNDSLTAFGSKHDKHANIAQGHIWSRTEQRDGLSSLLKYTKEKDLNMILETGAAHVEVTVLNKLINHTDNSM